MEKQVNVYLSDNGFIDNVLISAGIFMYKSSIVSDTSCNVMKVVLSQLFIFCSRPIEFAVFTSKIQNRLLLNIRCSQRKHFEY